MLNINEIKSKLNDKEYDFLRNDTRLGNNIVLLGLGGSYAYGTNNENSDIDIRGIATNTIKEILTGRDFENVTDSTTDTVVYSFSKIIKLLCGCNPNVIEMLGLKPEHYLYCSSIGKEILDNKKMFLSQTAAHSFGGYANAQLRRLESKSARLISQSEQEQHILKSIEHASVDYKRKYCSMPEDGISIYVDNSDRTEYDSEIFLDINLKHYPLRDYCGMLSEMQNIVKDYSRIGARNAKAIARDKLGKHMCHLVRLYLMCFDILEQGEIVTYREKEHDLLMSIRNGEYLDENKQPIAEFFEMVDMYEKRLEYAKENTDLPKSVDMNKVADFVISVNERIVKGEA